MARRRSIKWTQEMRLFVYERLVADFGTYRSWGKSNYPDGRKVAYHDFLQALRLELNDRFDLIVTVDAIKNQIAWAYTTQSEIKNRRYFANLLLNKAPALEAGFIGRDELPEHTAFKYGA